MSDEAYCDTLGVLFAAQAFVSLGVGYHTAGYICFQ